MPKQLFCAFPVLSFASSTAYTYVQNREMLFFSNRADLIHEYDQLRSCMYTYVADHYQ